jgi:DNA-binding transcriptional ArsR family regulator
MSFQLMAWAVKQTVGSGPEKAVLLALSNAANHHTGRCCPSIPRLAEETEFSEPTVKRALRALAEKGIITRERQRRGDGSMGVYDYGFPLALSEPTRDHSDPPTTDQTDPLTTDQSDLAEPRRTLNQEESQGTPASPPPIVTRRGWKVDRQIVTATEDDFARAILAEWNRETGQALHSKDWLAKIVLRIREHPELTLDEHEHVIIANLAAPWWKGHPTPSVIYGNGAQFERALLEAKKPSMNGRALTPAQIAAQGRR